MVKDPNSPMTFTQIEDQTNSWWISWYVPILIILIIRKTHCLIHTDKCQNNIYFQRGKIVQLFHCKYTGITIENNTLLSSLDMFDVALSILLASLWNCFVSNSKCHWLKHWQWHYLAAAAHQATFITAERDGFPPFNLFIFLFILRCFRFWLRLSASQFIAFAAEDVAGSLPRCLQASEPRRCGGAEKGKPRWRSWRRLQGPGERTRPQEVSSVSPHFCCQGFCCGNITQSRGPTSPVTESTATEGEPPQKKWSKWTQHAKPAEPRSPATSSSFIDTHTHTCAWSQGTFATEPSRASHLDFI